MTHLDTARELIATAREERATRPTPKVKILLVDDVEANLISLRAILDHPDYELVEADSGEEALRCVLRDDFAVILMDVQMPGLDGFETARLIKKRERSRNIPIVFVTATNKDDTYIFQGYEAGAIDYLFKPVDTNILRSKVAVFVELYLAQREVQAKNLELAVANACLRDADRHKDEFLGVISHELRTPLNFILGFASVLEDGIQGELAPEQGESVRRIMLGAERMLDLVNDLLDLSKIQAGRFSIEPQRTRYDALIADVLLEHAPTAATRGIALTARAPEVIEAMVDPQRVRQVLGNLLDNALKFTPAGGQVEVCVTQQAGRLRTEVHDTGPGIAPEDAHELFRPFRQLDMSVTRQVGGSGLGLAIAKALVEAHAGELGVECTPGAGSCFWFSLPLGL